MWRILFGLVVVVAAVYAWGFTHKRQIQTEIEIAAPREEVWQQLTNFSAYPEWNPFIKQVEGDAVLGRQLKVTIQADPEDDPMVFRPRVMTALRNRELRWIGKLPLPALFDGEHYFVLKETDAGTHLTHGERFRGVLLLLIDVDEFRPAFEAMNAALKARVEGEG